MNLSLLPLVLGFCMDLLIGDPHSIPHPVVLIGKLIASLEKVFRRIFPAVPSGERMAGMLLWLIVSFAAGAVPAAVLYLCGRIDPYLRLIAETLMVWQILAVRSLRTETMKVYEAVQAGDIHAARKSVSMIVGRDTENLDFPAVIRAAVETVAENTSDGIIAPLFYLAIGGAPAGFFYKAVNTMDSMLGYIDPPYTDFGRFPAKMDDILNYLPSRLTALLMLLAGWISGLDAANGWKIFRRDRYKHASPNAAQTESVCAGLLDIRLAGDAWYHGILHKKQYIGDDIREIKPEDIPGTCNLMYLTAFLMLLLSCGIRYLILI